MEARKLSAAAQRSWSADRPVSPRRLLSPEAANLRLFMLRRNRSQRSGERIARDQASPANRQSGWRRRAHAANSSSSAFASFRSSASKPFGEPAVDRSETPASLIALALIAPEPRHAHCGAEFPGLGLLLTPPPPERRSRCANSEPVAQCLSDAAAQRPSSTRPVIPNTSRPMVGVPSNLWLGITTACPALPLASPPVRWRSACLALGASQENEPTAPAESARGIFVGCRM